MDLVTPQIGLIFWMVVTFVTALIILKKFAWKPILKALDEREKSIQDALDAAKKAKEDMASLKSDNERILAEARNERDKIMKEARDAKDAIINEARSKATTEADRLLQIAREGIQNEKMAAITDLKNQVANLSIEIAEKVMRNQLSNDERQKMLIADLLKEIKIN